MAMSVEHGHKRALHHLGEAIRHLRGAKPKRKAEPKAEMRREDRKEDAKRKREGKRD